MAKEPVPRASSAVATNTLLKIESQDSPSPQKDGPFRLLVQRFAKDAVRRSETYPEDTRVPGGGE